MNNFTNKTQSFLLSYKWLLVPGIPLLFILITLLFIFYPTKGTMTVNQAPVNTPTLSPTRIPSGKEGGPGEGIEYSIDSRTGLQKKENLPDGTIKYTFASHLPDRPNVIIAKNEFDSVFDRTVTYPNAPVKISDFTKPFGTPPWIFKGSNFYGPGGQTYIYPELGFAFIANTKTGEVLEQHHFDPLKVEEYIKKYGDDIPDQP